MVDPKKPVKSRTFNIVFGALMVPVVILVGLGYEWIALPYALGCLLMYRLFDLKVQLGLLIIVLPFEYVGFDIGFTNLGPYDFILYIFILSILFRLIVEQDLRIPWASVWTALILMVAAFLPSLAFTASFAKSSKELVRLLIVIASAYSVWFGIQKTQDKEFVYMLIRLFVVETFLLALFAIYQAYTMSSIIQIVAGRVLPPVFGDVNFWGSYLLLAVCLAIGMTLGTVRASGKLVYALISLSLIVSLILTVSRGAAIAFSAAILLFLSFLFIEKRGIQKITAGLTAVLLVAAAVGILVSPFGKKAINLFQVTERYQDVVSGQDKSFQQRAKLLEIGWRVFRSSPLLGTGFGAFEKTFDHFRGSMIEVGSEREVHNTALRVLAETGLLGGIATGAFILVLFFTVFQAIRRTVDGGLKVVLFSFIAAFCSYFIMGLTLDLMSEAHFWIIAGLGLGASWTSGNSSQATGARS